MPYMYILECANGTYYTGSTMNLEKRLWEHENFIGANYTKKKHPVKLVYCEEYARIDEAFYREKQVQGWSHAKKKALIEHNWEKVKELAECMNKSHWRNAGFDSAQPANNSKPESNQRSRVVKRSLSEVETTKNTSSMFNAGNPIIERPGKTLNSTKDHRQKNQPKL